MKRFGIFIILVVFITLLAAVIAGAGPYVPVKNSKHNLAYEAVKSSGTGSISSADGGSGGSTEICIFCHTPHTGTSDVPLWNRSNMYSTYTAYTSDIISALVGSGYPAIELPTSATGYAEHVKTRICLSCHDGTIALGHLQSLPFEQGYKLTSDIPMTQGGTPLGAPATMPTNVAGYLGVDLRDDHPVSVKHDPSKDPELITIPQSAKVRLYGVTGSQVVATKTDGYWVECTSCHDPHDNQYGNFLIDTNAHSNICTSCHTKEKEKGAAGTPAHEGATSVSYSPPDGVGGNLGTTVGGISTTGVGCMTCHISHKSGVDSGSPGSASPATGKYLLSFKEDQTCFNNTNRWGQSVSVCHGTTAPGARDIETVMNNYLSGTRSAHKNNNPGNHELLEASNRGYGWLAAIQWHVTCGDCHNSHSAGSTRHTAPTNVIANSSPLYGAGGVEMTSWPGSNWGVPSSANFTPFETLGATTSGGATWPSPMPYYEYQVCFKCHSWWAWGGNATYQPTITDLPGLTSTKMTDQAQEFNPNNTSFHPVAAVTGRTQGTLLGSWVAGQGNQTMYCSDCHGDSSVTPAGPHASGTAAGKAGILVSAYTDTYTTTLSQTQPTGDLCFTCHSETVYSTGTGSQIGTGFMTTASTNLHTKHMLLSTVTGTGAYGYRCVNCHTRVPHGYMNKAMVVLKNDAVPYEAGSTGQGKINTAPLATSGSYSTLRTTPDCTTVAGCHQ